MVPAPSREESNEILPELKKRSLRQLDRVMNDFLMALSDHLFDLSSRPSARDQQEELYESMNTIKRSKDDMRKQFQKEMVALFDDLVASEADKKQKKGEEDEDQGEPVFEELNLVDIQDFEDSLSINRMIKTGQEAYATQLECLTIRYADLVEMDPLDMRLPMHIAQVCNAFRTSLAERELPSDVIPEIYNFFSELVVRKLDAYYTSLNAFLRERGIKADIEQEVKKHGSVLKKLENERRPKTPKKPKPKADREPASESDASLPSQDEASQLLAEARQSGLTSSGAGATAAQPSSVTAAPRNANSATGAAAGSSTAVPSGAAAAAGTTGAAAPAQVTATSSGGVNASSTASSAADIAGEVVDALRQQFSPDNMYRSVIDALNFKRSVDAGQGGTSAAAYSSGGVSGATSTTADGAAEGCNSADVAAVAQALNALQTDRQAMSQLQQVSSLRQYLDDNRGSFSALEGTTGFAPEGMNQLDLVDNLFQSIRTDVDVTPELQPSLRNLHVPLAKLSLLEPQFFLDRNHPARGVVDKLTQLASSAHYPNRALENRVNKIIDNIVDNYETDSGVFDTALKDIDRLVRQQETALQRNVERVVKTQDGQEKLNQAQQAVDKILRTRIRPPNAPKAMVDLVDNAWRELLVLTHVKDGPNSKPWKDYVKTLDLLSLWLLEQQRGTSPEQLKLERGLDAEPFVENIRQQITNALPTNVSHEPVLDQLKNILSGRAAVEQAEVAPPPADTTPQPEEVRKKVDSLPRLRRWVKRVEKLPLGTWLGFTDKDGKKRRMQLAWVSEEKDRFIFVNERGQKIADLSNIALARQLSRGVKPPTQADKLSLVDQSMYNTLEDVNKSLSFQKNHDQLTKLINKKAFMDQMEVVLRQTKVKKSSNALLYIDIDNFALVNEVYDEVTGDQVLSEFAKLLAQQHDEKTASSRLVGNKFAVLLQDRSMEQAVAHAEKIRSDIEQSPVTIESEAVAFTVSIGVAGLLEHNESVEEVLANAETAVGKAKEDGRNKVVLFHEEQTIAEQYKKEQAMAVAQIEKTLEQGDFILQAQPIVKTASVVAGNAEVKHYEILMGMKGEDGKLSSPQDFIIQAEQHGYMVQIDRWVIRQVFTWINEQMDNQKQIPYLSVNLSGNSVTDDDFLDYLLEQISEYGVGTNRICFEITETGTISNMIKAADFVRELKNIGCKFSIDDFGTGLSSHSYLRELPVDYLKIDGTFIANIHENDNDYAMVKSINDLAHFLNQQTIAEFVENDAIVAKLSEIGVDYLQGYGVGKPVLLDDLAGQLAALEK